MHVWFSQPAHGELKSSNNIKKILDTKIASGTLIPPSCELGQIQRTLLGANSMTRVVHLGILVGSLVPLSMFAAASSTLNDAIPSAHATAVKEIAFEQNIVLPIEFTLAPQGETCSCSGAAVTSKQVACSNNGGHATYYKTGYCWSKKTASGKACGTICQDAVSVCSGIAKGCW